MIQTFELHLEPLTMLLSPDLSLGLRYRRRRPLRRFPRYRRFSFLDRCRPLQQTLVMSVIGPSTSGLHRPTGPNAHAQP